MRSLRFRLFVGICGLVAAFVLLSSALSTVFLPRYYYSSKKAELRGKFDELFEVYEGEPEDHEELLQTWQQAEGLRITIFNELMSTKYDTQIFGENGKGQIHRRRQTLLSPMPNPPIGPLGYGKFILMVKIGELRLTPGNSHTVVVRDENMQLDYVSLLGRLNNRDYVLLRTPAAAIKESAHTANRFFIFTGFIMLASGGIFAFSFSNRFTQPILEISVIAQKMARLDFSAKYSVKTKDELGQLGGSINVLSEKLEQSILSLQAANEGLKGDIERKMQLDEMRKEFIANVSHELKTPISLIQGYAEGLQHNVVDNDEDRRFYCEVITDEAAKMDRLVKQLLELARLETGHMKPEPEEFDIREVIQRVTKRFVSSMKGKELTISVRIQHPTMVWADEGMTEQVLTNYLSNAVKYARANSSIDIWVERRDGKLTVSMSNKGNHIPPEHLEKIWMSFYKLDKARTRGNSGEVYGEDRGDDKVRAEIESTGLGLSIVKALQNAQDNECGVYNTEDGVVFWFNVDCTEENIHIPGA